MILTKTILIRINNKNIEHYRSQDIDVVYGELYDMDVKYVPRYSKYKIMAKCETCGAEKELPMQKYHQNWERSESYNCKACNNITLRKTCLERYGVDNTSKLEYVNEKRKKTCLEKYGNEYAIASEQTKEKTKKTLFERYGGHQSRVPEIHKKIKDKGMETKINRGLVIGDDELSEWQLYRRKVSNVTNRYKKKLYEDWEGIDYYDGEYIKENIVLKHTDTKYPTIDHKISLHYGFKNNISPEVIGDISNLCITKRKNNCSKSRLTEEEYLNKKTQS